MTEVTEFMIWRRALAETPTRLEKLLVDAPPGAGGLVSSMVRHDAVMTARLARLLDAPGPPAAADGEAAFSAGRRRLLELLDRVDAGSLHREMRLASGKTVDPWRLAGELVELDVRHLAELRRLAAADPSTRA